MHSFLRLALCCALAILPAAAGAEIGFAALANSAPDGYTIGFVNTPPLRYLPPAQYEAPVRDADATYRALWKEMPWSDK
jgi:tripartite-type tricarboxylate transporter receptor subunit TctC